MVSKASLLVACATIAIAGLPASALAQAAPAPDTAASEPGPGDIIVTARKRQESILRVPVVESVLTPEIITKNAIVDVGGVTRNVPGLVVGGNVLTVGTQISLRGVGTSTLDAGVDQSVSLNIDGLQFSQGATYSVGLFDMAQIEVLKGPQALFFGKNSPAGVIAIRTNDPGSKPEIIASQSYEFYSHEKRSEVIVSLPVSDTFGFRIAGMYSDDDGYFLNRATAQPGTGAVTPDPRWGRTNQYIIRGTLVWKPSSDGSAHRFDRPGRGFDQHLHRQALDQGVEKLDRLVEVARLGFACKQQPLEMRKPGPGASGDQAREIGIARRLVPEGEVAFPAPAVHLAPGHHGQERADHVAGLPGELRFEALDPVPRQDFVSPDQ